MSEFAQASIARERFSAVLLVGFAATALLLAAIGIYGVMSYAVRRRMRELGVRSAMGATPAQLASSVVRRGLLLTGAGSALGLLAAMVSARALEGLLFGVRATDAATLASAPLLLAVVSIAACWLPVRHASRVDPVIALRSE